MQEQRVPQFHLLRIGRARLLNNFAVNTTTGSTSVTIPIPTSSSGSVINEGLIQIDYYEPCMPSNGACESPSPTCAPFSTCNYRPWYRSKVIVPWSASDPFADVSGIGLLMLLHDFIESPEQPQSGQVLCH